MEAIITIVGFLGAGKTTLLKQLTNSYLSANWQPFIVLNDYQNAFLDAQHFIQELPVGQVKALSGSCICCSGIQELREYVNRIPERKNGVTLIEANGTSDSYSLMSFLGVGLKERFLPPIQIAVVDVSNWQKRGEHNSLEASQIQVSSSIVLTHYNNATNKRLNSVKDGILRLNPNTKIVLLEHVTHQLIPILLPNNNKPKPWEHLKSHWASSAIDLPRFPNENYLYSICDAIPRSILRIKGCTQLGTNTKFTFFERKPNNEVIIRPFNGEPITGPKILTIGPGSSPELLNNIIKEVLKDK
ncbi:GTP-binding protein [Croceivirga sp. JEA036]|uniref:GTP-binding protein n=1 Tax=Croceivirga sp. JEA036 TaxID=2721162 RepID=UPI00143C5BD0|nr:GTP-binding protein [Croceivirga sp. JEA036]NJB37579.1 GTP-binding protein [Croceivirga sp. JEA036]